MVTEAQEKLAHHIANAGLWKYSSVLALMEKKSPLVEMLKASLNVPSNVSYKIAGKSVTVQERAYANARLAEELQAASFAQAYVFYLNYGTPAVAKCVTDVAAKIKSVREQRPEITVEWIQEQQAKWLDERDAYMTTRIQKCQE